MSMWGLCWWPDGDVLLRDQSEEHLWDVAEVTGWARWDGDPAYLYDTSFITLLAKRIDQ